MGGGGGGGEGEREREREGERGREREREGERGEEGGGGGGRGEERGAEGNRVRQECGYRSAANDIPKRGQTYNQTHPALTKYADEALDIPVVGELMTIL